MTWYTKTSYALIFKNGTETVKTTSIPFDTEIINDYLPTSDPTKSGWTFAGWDKAIPEKMPAKDVTLNATWTKDQYKITYTNTKWVEHTNAWSYSLGDEITFAALSKEGYTFGGWTPVKIETTDTWDKTVNASWTPVNYTISYEGTDKADETYTIETATFTIWALADKTWYKFVWWTGDGYTVPVKEIKIQKWSTWNKEFTANWEPINYTITYNLNGWTNGANPSSYTIESEDIDLVNPSKEGYNFVRWEKDDEPITQIEQGSTGNVELTAIWDTATSYAITYNGVDGADNTMNPWTYTVNDLVVLKNPSKAWYTFLWWTEWNIIEKGSTWSKTFTATWQKNDYKITYELNGWTNHENNPSWYDVTSSVITLSDPTKEWYDFAWWTPSDTIPAGSTWDKEFTATWTAVEYDITYVLWEGATNNANNPATYTVEDTILLYAPTNNGKVFLWWKIWDSDTVYPTLVLTHMTWDKTLTAVWWEDTYQITYVLNGWVNADGNPTNYTHGQWVASFTAPTKRWYQFTAWTPSSISNTDTWDKTITATWSVINYTITYNNVTESEKTAANNPATYTVEDEDIILHSPARDGYTFKWWTEWSKIENGSIGAKTFTANWEAVSYPITYELNGWTNNPWNPSSYTKASETITLQAPEKKGYTFAGWTEGNTIPTWSTWAKTFTATWTANSVEYYVYYYAWENILWVEIKTANAGTQPELTTANYKVFDGYTKPTASTTCPIIEEWKICKVTWYTKTSYALIFKNGTETVKTTSIPFDTEIINDYLPTSDPTKSGWTFAGWDKAIPEKMPAKDVTLNATWTKDQYKITYTNTKWVEHTNAWSYSLGDEITFAALSKEGYTFGGWTPVKIETTDTWDKTVNASWTPVNYTISYNLDGWTNSTYNVTSYNIESNDIILQNPTKEWFRFIWWTGEWYITPIQGIVIRAWSTGNRTYTAVWEENEVVVSYNTYTIKHFKQNIHNDEYIEVLADRDIKLWIVGAATSATSKVYPWFTAKPFEQVEVLSNGSAVVNIYYDRNTYTVTWKNFDWTVLETDENVRYEATPIYDKATPTKAATAQYTYTFVWWDNELAPVREDVTYTATYSSTVNKYTVTFVDEDETTILKEATEYDYGTLPANIQQPATPTKDADEIYTYTFAGWIPELSEVNGNMIYKATYESHYREYTIKFTNWDDSIISEKTYHYWDNVEVPNNPSRPDDEKFKYGFASWDSDVVPVDGEKTYKAVYIPTYVVYTVTWKDYDDTVLSWATYHYNDNLVVLASPTRPADDTYTYTFKAWSPTTSQKVTANADYIATYNSTPKWWGGGWWGWSWGGWSSKSSDKTHWAADGQALTWDVLTWDVDILDNVDAVDNVYDNADLDEDKQDNQLEKSEDTTWVTEKYSPEEIDAYTWAYGKWITSMPTIEDANLNGYITREQLAKMMVVYMSKVLWKKPVINKSVKYRDISVKARWQEFYDYVQLAYQYQIMWIDAKWRPIKYFNPSGKVTRAEFATVLSRVLYGSKYNQNWKNYYEKHIKALKNAGILTNTDPTVKELRWWIILMLYRSQN